MYVLQSLYYCIIYHIHIAFISYIGILSKVLYNVIHVYKEQQSVYVLVGLTCVQQLIWWQSDNLNQHLDNQTSRYHTMFDKIRTICLYYLIREVKG